MRALCAAVAAACAFGTVQPAFAASALAIAPLRLDLGSKSNSATVTVTNAGGVPVDVIAAAERWTQTDNRSILLEQAPEIVVFPRSFTMQPHETRTLRIGTLQAAGTTERAYRLLVTQLPSNADRLATTLQFITRLSVPVFVGVGAQAGEVVPEAAHINGEKLGIVVRAPGTTHAFVRKTHVDAIDSNGTTIASVDIPGWYVLGGTTQRFTASLPARICHRIARMRMRAIAEGGEAVERMVVPARACSTAS